MTDIQRQITDIGFVTTVNGKTTVTTWDEVFAGFCAENPDVTIDDETKKLVKKEYIK